MIPAVSLGAAALLAAAHVLARRLAFARAPVRHWVLSLLGGVSLAYAFAHLLPEVVRAQERLAGGPAAPPWAFLLALAGALVFYGVERYTSTHRRTAPGSAHDDASTAGAFWLSISAFSAYNFFIGILVAHIAATRGLVALAVFAAALVLHFVVNDVALRGHHAERYDAVGRWLLAAAVPAGWAFQWQVTAGEVAVSVGVAVIAGGVTLNVLKEELPAGQNGHFGALVTAAAAFSAVVVLAA